MYLCPVARSKVYLSVNNGCKPIINNKKNTIMFSTCNSACVDTQTLTPTSQCKTYQRNEVPVRLLLALCTTNFPTGNYDDNVLATAIETLITNGEISASFELADFVWGEPTTTTKQYRPRRSPNKTIITGRQLTAKDFNATDEDYSGTAFPYFDRDFYKNVVQNKAVKIRGYVTAQGRIYLFLDMNGNFMDYDITWFIGWDNDVENSSIEFKNYNINFAGDPISNITTPYLDIPAANAVSQLGWLYQAN